MSVLFDKLQEYIDKKIAGIPGGLEDLFIEYGLKEIYPYLPDIKIVADDITNVRVVGVNIADVITCADNVEPIKAAPGAADDAVAAADLAVISATGAEEANLNSNEWATEDEDIIVDDGINPPGYSAYHWARKALDTSPSNYYMLDGTQPIIADFQANNYQLKFVAAGTDATSAVNLTQLDAVALDVTGLETDLAELDTRLTGEIDVVEADVLTRLPLDGTEKMTGNLVINNADGFSAVLLNDNNDVTRGGLYHHQDNNIIELVRFDENGRQLSKLALGSDGCSLTGPDGGQPIVEDIRDITTKEYVDSHRVRVDNPHVVTKSQVGLGSADNTSDAAKPISDATATALGLKYDKTDFLVESTGGPDGGKPIVLDNEGKLHPSISGSGLYPVGMYTPEAALEYPDPVGEAHGAYWGIEGVDPALGYTFTGGDLDGTTLFNGDAVIYGSQAWGFLNLNIDPNQYYRVDGSLAIAADFSGGGFKISNIADGTANQDAVTLAQINAAKALFVKIDGTTPMTGEALKLWTNLKVGDGTKGNSISIRGSASDQNAYLRLKRPDDSDLAWFYGNDAEDHVTLRLLDDTGAVSTDFSFLRDGNISVEAEDPTETNHLTRKDYVDGELSTGLALKVNKAGDTMTGPLAMRDSVYFERLDGTKGVALHHSTDGVTGDGFKIKIYDPSEALMEEHSFDEQGLNTAQVSLSGAAPTEIDHATRKDYVDAIEAALIADIATKVDIAGDTMTGQLKGIPAVAQDDMVIRSVMEQFVSSFFDTQKFPIKPILSPMLVKNAKYNTNYVFNIENWDATTVYAVSSPNTIESAIYTELAEGAGGTWTIQLGWEDHPAGQLDVKLNFTANDGAILASDPTVAILQVQHVGTTPVQYINDDFVVNKEYSKGFTEILGYNNDDFALNMSYNRGFTDEVIFSNNDFQTNESFNDGFTY